VSDVLPHPYASSVLFIHPLVAYHGLLFIRISLSLLYSILCVQHVCLCRHVPTSVCVCVSDRVACAQSCRSACMKLPSTQVYSLLSACAC